MLIKNTCFIVLIQVNIPVLVLAKRETQNDSPLLKTIEILLSDVVSKLYTSATSTGKKWQDDSLL